MSQFLPDAHVTVVERPCLTCGHARNVHVEHHAPWCVACAPTTKTGKYPADGCRAFVSSGMTVRGTWP